MVRHFVGLLRPKLASDFERTLYPERLPSSGRAPRAVILRSGGNHLLQAPGEVFPRNRPLLAAVDAGRFHAHGIFRLPPEACTYENISSFRLIYFYTRV